MVPDDAPDGLGHALLDGKVHARAVVDELGVDGCVVSGGRRKAHCAACLGRLTWLPRGGRVHDDGLVGERRVVMGRRLGPEHGLGLGLGMRMELRRVWRLQRR